MNWSKLITKWFGLDHPGRMDSHVRSILARGLADQLDAMGSRGLRIALHRDESSESVCETRKHTS